MLRNNLASNANSKIIGLIHKAIVAISVVCLFSFVYAGVGDFVYDSKGKRNPFVPLVTPDGKLLKLDDGENSSGIALEGIIYDEKGVSYAIVNQEVVKVSDMVGQYQVLKIEKNRVIFVKDGEPLEIELKKEE